MKKYIITISREFGCNAREIARRLASKLGIPFYDKDLVDLAAEKANLNRNIIEESDEVINMKQSRLFSEFGYGSSSSFYSEKAIAAQAAVIREIADKETCIFFGRCSDYILREYSNVFNIFLYAPIEERIKHIAESYELTDKDAEKLVKRIDVQRHNYYKYVTGKDRGDRHCKHLMIDVSNFGMESSVNLLYDATKHLFPDNI